MQSEDRQNDMRHMSEVIKKKWYICTNEKFESSYENVEKINETDTE